VKPGGGSRKTDHDRVNQFLARVRIIEELAERFDPSIDDADLPGRIDDNLLFQTIALMRQQAWDHAELLADPAAHPFHADVGVLGGVPATPFVFNPLESLDQNRRRVLLHIEEFAANQAQAVRSQYAYNPLSPDAFARSSAARDAHCGVNNWSVAHPRTPASSLD
jgi:hypothetical protein